MGKEPDSTKKLKDTADDQYVLERYQTAIDYYLSASKSNKKSYKRTRTITISLGALVTLISSLASASFIANNSYVSIPLAIITPVCAAILTIVGGLANSFYWGATWRDMMINAANLEKERDDYIATKPDKRDVKKELEKLNGLILNETDRFFQRVLDSEVIPQNDQKDK